MIVTCPTYESDGKTLSPLAGQAMVKNLYQGRYGVVANPGADRIAQRRGVAADQHAGRSEGARFVHAHRRAGLLPGIRTGRISRHDRLCQSQDHQRSLDAACATGSTAADCTHEVKGHITTARMSRTPDERLYGSGTHDSYAFTQCYVSLGDPDGADFAFPSATPMGTSTSQGFPPGNWKITTFDQWNDQVVDGITTAVGLCDLSRPTPSTGHRVHELQEQCGHGRGGRSPVAGEHLHPHLPRHGLHAVSRDRRQAWTGRWSTPTFASATAASPTSTTPT